LQASPPPVVRNPLLHPGRGDLRQRPACPSFEREVPVDHEGGAAEVLSEPDRNKGLLVAEARIKRPYAQPAGGTEVGNGRFVYAARFEDAAGRLQDTDTLDCAVGRRELPFPLAKPQVGALVDTGDEKNPLAVNY
jgi:hypothetical protein